MTFGLSSKGKSSALFAEFAEIYEILLFKNHTERTKVLSEEFPFFFEDYKKLVMFNSSFT